MVRPRYIGLNNRQEDKKMKEKTLYYRVTVKEVNRMVNDGFIIATIYDGKLFSLEGVFTNDYLSAKIGEETISIEYYSRHEALGQYEKQWEIPMKKEYLEFPIYLEAQILEEQDYITMDKDENEDEAEKYEIIQIDTIEQISQNYQKEMCKSILQNFKKNNNVFN